MKQLKVIARKGRVGPPAQRLRNNVGDRVFERKVTPTGRGENGIFKTLGAAVDGFVDDLFDLGIARVCEPADREHAQEKHRRQLGATPQHADC